MMLGVSPRLDVFSAHSPDMEYALGDSLHALPEPLGFADLDNSVYCTTILRVRTAHTDNLKFAADDIEGVGEQEGGSSSQTPAGEFAHSEFWSFERIGRW